jgi:arginine/serine-rich splicing factor 17
MIGFFESLKVKACEAKSEFPTRHDWDTFFRDSNKMNEMHPGERPDTVYLAFLPCKWFLDLRCVCAYVRALALCRQSSADRPKDQPSEFVMRRVFETFGDIRCVDIPMCDKYRRQMSKSGTSVRVRALSHTLRFQFDTGRLDVWCRSDIRSVRSVCRVHQLSKMHGCSTQHEVGAH